MSRRMAMTLLPLAVLLGSTAGASAEKNADRQASSELGTSAVRAMDTPEAEDQSGASGDPTAEDANTPPVISVGDGVRRFSINPTLEFGALCAWAEVSILQPPNEAYNESGGVAPENCAIEVNTIKPYVIVSGRSDLVVDWAGVLGLAERNVERIVLRLEDGSSHELALKKWPKTPWSWFSYDFHERPFPDLVLAYDSSGRLLAKMDLASRIRPYCLVDEVCRRDSERMPGPKINAYATGDDIYWFSQSDARRTYEVVTHDPSVAQILDGQQYWVEDLGLWLTCNWNHRLGTWARVVLAKRGAVEASWPYVELTPDGDHYVQRETRRRVARVKSLLVIVDRRGRIVTVDPYEHDWDDLTFSSARIVSTTTDPGVHWVGQTDCNDP